MLNCGLLKPRFQHKYTKCVIEYLLISSSGCQKLLRNCDY